MSEEIFDIVDDQDRVIGQAPRSEVHRRKLLHRAVSIFVFDSRGRLLLQQRSAAKDEYPLCYTSSASGHVTAGETYDETAPRELEEELGLTTAIERLAKFPAGPETANEFTVLYRSITDTPPRFDPSEIAGGAFYELAEIDEWLVRKPDEFSPPFRICFRWYQQWLKGASRVTTGFPNKE
ncbi:MAG TPA: NUDIX domain-containing protein [Planctomycetaceae bacterium]|nr:NUDIX domain-containing protein [Planctomycetaceae bacterium]